MTVKRWIVSSLLLVLLASGCMSAAEVRGADERKCRARGFAESDAVFAECLRRLELQRKSLLSRPPVELWRSPVIIHRPVFVGRPH